MREDLAPTYAEKLGISKQELEQLKQNASQTDILFVDNMIHQYSRYFLNIPSEDKILTALYLVKHYDSAAARKKLKEAGYTESYFLWADYGEIGHIQAAYDLAQQGISTAQQDEAYDQRLNAERTAFLSIMGGQLVNRLMTGPAFDAATGYSDQSMLDQLEKNGYLTAEQRKTIDSRFNQGMEKNSKIALDLENLPNVYKVRVDQNKVKNYALNPNHPIGKDKAKVFESSLGYNQSNADQLINQIQSKLPNSKAILGIKDQFGQRYTVDIVVTGPNGNSAVVRTGWILEPETEVPRMTTIYVK